MLKRLAILTAIAALVHASTLSGVAIGDARQVRFNFGMTTTAIDVTQAERAGNSVTVDDGWQILRDPAGRELARVPVEGVGTSGYDIVYGDCGSAYFEIYDSGGNDRKGFWGTGFDISGGSAYDFDWNISVFAQYGSFDRDWYDAGPGGGSSWDWTPVVFTTTADSDGRRHYGEVSSGVAYLYDGRVCSSGGPESSAVIF